jgi:hypothetical protein
MATFIVLGTVRFIGGGFYAVPFFVHDLPDEPTEAEVLAAWIAQHGAGRELGEVIRFVHEDGPPLFPEEQDDPNERMMDWGRWF